MFMLVILKDKQIKQRQLFMSQVELEDAVAAFAAKNHDCECEAYDPDNKLICTLRISG